MCHLALEVLVDSLFDHAGIFPPTERPLEEAYKVAAEFDTRLARPQLINSEMVLPVKKLETINEDDLLSFGFKKEKIFRISALSDFELNQNSKEQVLDNLITCQEFNKKSGRLEKKIISFDLKISDDLEVLDRSFLTTFDSSSIHVYIEPNLSVDDWEERLLAIVDLISGSKIGLKCRGTGPTGIASRKMAHAIYQATDRNLDFKVTGGFHHMVVGEKNNAGFLNFTAAVVLSKLKSLTPERIATLLDNSAIEEFRFSTDTLKYKEFEVPFTDIANARKTNRFSIGCCNPMTPDKELLECFGRP